MQRFGVLVTGFAFVAAVALVQPSLAQRPPPDPADIFIPSDPDDYDPGLAVGEQFPSIRALYQGEEINDIDQFIRDKGAVFIATRSVDW
jgi:hypothetical protein